MKLDAFEKIIRKIVREEIEYSIEKLISNTRKDENVRQSVRNEAYPEQSLSEIRNRLKMEYNSPNQSGQGDLINEWTRDDEDRDQFLNAPSYVKDALTRDYSSLLKKLNK
jgi:hypothetical protein